MNKMNKKGFTLIEMLVVIAIIAILVAIIVPVVSNSTAKAKGAADAANLRSVAASAAIDYLDNNEINTDFITNAPECETDSTYKLEIHNVNGTIAAYFVKGSDYFGVDYYSEIAETGTAPASYTSAASATTKLEQTTTE